MPAETPHLTREVVERIAHLARLSLGEAEAELMCARLSAILGHVQSLHQLETSGVEPMAHPFDQTERLDDDLPGPLLANEILMRMAPRTFPPFVRVSKVLGDGGG